MKMTIKRFWQLISINKHILVIGAVITIGVIALSISRAAVPSISIEAEAGNPGSIARTIIDGSASNNSAIKFVDNNANTNKKCSELTNIAFCDDFDGAANTAPDSTKWNVFNSGSSWGGQCWRNANENIALDGQGNLRQTLVDKGSTQCNDNTGNPTSITSGGMDTTGKKYFQFGKFEIRAKLSCAQSVWGSIWTSTGNSGNSWPTSGEIDIYEIIGTQLNRLQQTIWGGDPKYHIATYYTISKPLCQDFHTYGMEWRQGYVQFTLDGINTNIVRKDVEAAGKPWPLDTNNQRLLIDLQIGGPGWPSQGNPNLSELPSSMLIDYVHIFN